jgi:hypothetical protein
MESVADTLVPSEAAVAADTSVAEAAVADTTAAASPVRVRVSTAAWLELERMWASDTSVTWKRKLCDELEFVIEQFKSGEWTHERCIEHMKTWLEHNVVSSS